VGLNRTKVIIHSCVIRINIVAEVEVLANGMRYAGTSATGLAKEDGVHCRNSNNLNPRRSLRNCVCGQIDTLIVVSKC